MEKDKSITVEFRDKVIFIFSPQPWSYLQISKHHYACALATHNRVYFIIPPISGKKFSFLINKERKGLYVLNYTLAAPFFLRFKLPILYKLLLRVYLSSLLRTKLPAADVAFDFGCYQQFDSMDFIPACYKIYFPVDDFGSLQPDDRGASLVLTVSRNIQKKFPFGKCHFINHGLAAAFSEKALLQSPVWRLRNIIKVGCSGNLFIRFIDTEILETIILQHPAIEFHFFGSNEPDLSVTWQRKWRDFLQNAPNVHVRGMLSAYELVDAYEEMDIFLLCYKPDYINYHGENSHKVLEYLSTGKVLVSTYLTIYKDTELFEMSPYDKNEELVSVFEKVINAIDEYNSLSRSELRKNFALDYTYDKNLIRISKMISNSR